MTKDQVGKMGEPGTMEVKPSPGVNMNTIKEESNPHSGELGDQVIKVKVENGTRTGDERWDIKMVSVPDKNEIKDVSLDKMGTEKDVICSHSERVPGGGIEKVSVKSEDVEERLEKMKDPAGLEAPEKEETQEKKSSPVKEEPVDELETKEEMVISKEVVEVKEEAEVNVMIRNEVPLCDQMVKTESPVKRKEKKKKKKKSKKEKKKEKKARKEAKKRKRELEEQESADKSKKKKKKVNNSEAVEAAKAAVDDPPRLQPVPAEEDLFYMSNAYRYDCPPNRDFTGFDNVEPKYQIDDSNVDEMSPWKIRRCVGPILDYVKEQKAKGLDLDVPYEGQEIIKAPDPPKKSTPELRRKNGGRFRKRGRVFDPSFNTSHQEEKVEDEYSSLLSGYVQEKTAIDYF